MKKVLLDSCVFFEMVYISNVNARMGKDGVKQYIDEKTKKLSELVNKIKQVYPQSYIEKHKNDDPVYTALTFVSYVTDKIQNLSTEINEQYLIVNDNTQTGTDRHKAYEKVQELKQERQKYYDLKTNAGKNNFDDIRTVFQRLGPAILFERYLNNQVALCIPYVGYKEILSHIDNGQPRPYSDFLYIPKQDADRLLKECTVVSFASPNAAATLKDIARKFRTLGENEVNATPMQRDKNFNGEYGDSKIAAVSAISGIVLVTTNGKDFIYKEKYNKEETKRQHIQNVCIENEPITTDTLPYTLLEYLCGKYNESTKNTTLPSRTRPMSGVKNEIVY